MRKQMIIVTGDAVCRRRSGLSLVVLVLAIGGCRNGEPNREAAKIKDLTVTTYHGIARKEIKLDCLLSSGKDRVLTATFTNLESERCEFQLEELALQLYDPVTDLPVSFELEPLGSHSIQLTYPLQAGLQGASDIQISFTTKRKNSSTSVGSKEHGRVDNPDFTYTLDGSGKLYIYHRIPDRVLQVRLLQIKRNRDETLAAPVIVEVPFESQTLVPGMKGFDLEKDLVEIDYQFRLVPNKEWHKGNVNF